MIDERISDEKITEGKFFFFLLSAMVTDKLHVFLRSHAEELSQICLKKVEHTMVVFVKKAQWKLTFI